MEAGFFTKHKKMKSKKGSVLLLVTIITGAMLMLGFTCMQVASTQYKIRKNNSEVKRAFYMSEDGLNYAYAQVYELICEAVTDSIDKSDEFLLHYPDDFQEAENLFYNNYKFNISGSIHNRVKLNSNPLVKVTYCSGMFTEGELTMNISSKYVSDSGIMKTTLAGISVMIPDYKKIRTGEIDFTSLLYFNKLNL